MVKVKLIVDEQYVIDYFNGKNFYELHQKLETPPYKKSKINGLVLFTYPPIKEKNSNDSID